MAVPDWKRGLGFESLSEQDTVNHLPFLCSTPALLERYVSLPTLYHTGCTLVGKRDIAEFPLHLRKVPNVVFAGRAGKEGKV
jgi:hypothetical protein